MYFVLYGVFWFFVIVVFFLFVCVCCFSFDKFFSFFFFSGFCCFESWGIDLCVCGWLFEYVFFVIFIDFCFIFVFGFLDFEDWGICCLVVFCFVGGCWVLLDVVIFFVCVFDLWLICFEFFVGLLVFIILLVFLLLCIGGNLGGDLMFGCGVWLCDMVGEIVFGIGLLKVFLYIDFDIFFCEFDFIFFWLCFKIVVVDRFGLCKFNWLDWLWFWCV